jgi:CRP/FNR family cyclic AMP-dependent transcriptional regulator
MPGADILRSVPLFSGLSDAEIDLVSKSSRRLKYPRLSVVFHEGDPGDFLLVILRGRVKATLVGEAGEETTIATLERGELFGEMAILDEGPRSATVMTIEDTEFLQITRAPFLALIKAHPSIAAKIMSHLAGALREANEQIRTLSMFDAYGRVIRCLLGIARKHGQAEGTRILIRPKPSFQEMARMIGCSRETVSRAVKTLEETGYLSVIEGGLAIEQRAIRKYMEPAMGNLGQITSSKGASPVSRAAK